MPSAIKTLEILTTALDERDVQAILEFPFPPEEVIQDENSELHETVAKACFELLSQLVLGEFLPYDSTADDRDGGAAERLWKQVFRVVGAYYDACIASMFHRNALHLQQGLGIGDITLPEALQELPAEERASSRATGLSILVAFTMTILGAEVVRLLRGISLRHRQFPSAAFASAEQLVHRQAYAFCGLVIGDPSLHTSGASPLNTVAQRMLITVLDALVDSYSLEGTWNKEHHLGAFSMIDCSELDLLARRDEQIVKKYGAGNVATRFEQQIALIMQSFGMYVIEARRAERSVDLICIAPDETSRLVFLLEAKSGARPYALPTTDERALREYVQSVRRLSTIPPLQFVLIVGGNPGRTLDGKLHKLETAIRMPVRFLAARDLAQLREQVLSPLPLEDLVSVFVDGPRVVPSGFADRVVTIRRKQEEAHKHLVRTMLGPLGDYSED